MNSSQKSRIEFISGAEEYTSGNLSEGGYQKLIFKWLFCARHYAGHLTSVLFKLHNNSMR